MKRRKVPISQYQHFDARSDGRVRIIRMKRQAQIRRRRFVSFLTLMVLAIGLTFLIGLHDQRGNRNTAPAATIASLHNVDLVILSDTNRDGMITKEDMDDHDRWSWGSGAFILANVDDDDQNQEVDALDTVVNGEKDAEDLTLIKVLLSDDLVRNNPRLQLSVDNRGNRHTHVFQKVGDAWEYLNLRSPADLTLNSDQPHDLTLGIEAKDFADEDWDGIVKLRLEAIASDDSDNDDSITDSLQMRVSPWLMLPNTAQSTDVYVGEGHYNNEPMLAQLQDSLPSLGVTMHTVFAEAWEEMWLQDTMEIGYQQTPGHPIMHVVLQANRGIDPFPPTLLGPDMGFITVGKYRTVPLEDELVDWMGNLEVTPPLPGFPLGRIYYGKNIESGVGFAPAMVAFLEAQGVQSPVAVDTSWLLVKHVDEIFSFVSDRNGNPYLLMNNLQEGADLVQKLQSSYRKGDEYVGVPGTLVDEALEYVEDNRWLQQEKLDKILAKAEHDFNLDPKQVITLPVMVYSTTEAQTLWSNPVNSVHINGTVFVGDPVAPQVRGKDLIQAEIRQKLEPLGLEVQFLDDSAYQANAGNVHCATNSKRLPVVDEMWKHLPDGLVQDS